MRFRNGHIANRANKRGNIIALTTLVFILGVIAIGISNIGSIYADPAFRASASANNGSGSTSLTVNAPSGTQSGDVMVAHIVVQTSGNSIAAPSGWHMIKRQDTSSNIATATYYKVAGSSEPTSYTWNFGTSGEASGGIASYSGVDTTNPIDANDAQYNNGTTNLDNAGLTTTVNNDMLVYAAGIVNPSTSVTQPTGFTQQWKANSSTATSSVLAQEAYPTAGTTGTIHGTLGGNYSSATQLLALRPAGIYASTPSGISLRSSSADNNGTGSTSLTMNNPSKTQSGDVLVAHVVVQTAGNSIAGPSGWHIIKRQDTSSSLATATYYKVAGSSEPSTYTWNFGTSGQASGTIGDYAGVNTTTPIDTSNTQYNNGVSTVDNAGVTTAYANDMLVEAVGIIRAASVQAPAGLTEGSFSASNAQTASQMFNGIASSIGATGNIHTTMTIGTYSTVTQLIALVPASATPPTPPSGISLRSSSASNTGGSSSSLTLNVPSGTQSGDVMIAHVVVRTAGNAITAPTGWSQIVRKDTGSALSTVAYYKVASSSEPSSYTWNFGTSGEASGGIGSYIGVNNATPVDVSNGQLNTSSNNVDNSGVTTTATNDMLVYAAGVVQATSVVLPSGFTESSSSASNSLTTSEVSQKLDASTGATGTVHGTENGGTSYSNVTLLIALRPMNYADNLPVVHVSGTLSSNQTWISGNVYVVDSALTIPDGKTLTINPGTIVKVITDGLDIQSGGTLNATGNSTTSIIFTSYKNDSAGGDSNGDGSSTSPAAGDYTSAIAPNGGTVNVLHASFSYGSSDIGGSSGGSHLTVTDSSFTDSDVGISVVNDASISLQRNSFALATAGAGNWAIFAEEGNLSGIVLSGTNKNTFSGSGANITVMVQGSVPSGATWEVASGPVLYLDTSGNPGVYVHGTINIDSGVIVKQNGGTGFEVASDGTLNVTGASGSPVVFTSYKDDSAGGDSNGDGSSTSPAAGDYTSAIAPYGGTVDVLHADFKYGSTAINSSGGSVLTVADSSFEDSDAGISAVGDASISLQRNSFALATAGAGNWAIFANESDLSGITLSGTNKNTFSGSGANIGVAVQGDVPSGSTWEVASGPVLILEDGGGPGVVVDGTVNIDSGVKVKLTGGTGFKVQSDGILNASGSSGSPVVFTSTADDSVGGDSYGDGSTTGSAGDYTTAIRFEHPGSSDVISYAVFKYGASTLSIGALGTLSVDHTQFANNEAAFDADTTSTENPVLESLAPDCLWPYANSIHITDSWFGAGSGSGHPGDSADISGYLSLTMPSGYTGLSSAYNDFQTLAPLTVNGGDNTIPWTIWTCTIPGLPPVAFPVTPVYLPNFAGDTAIASSELWTDTNLSE